MLLDSHLVEKFHALHRQRLSGVLQASGDGFSLGICLVEGEPVAIDLGEDLEQAFAHACGTYHKLDEAGAAELSAAIAGGAKGREYLVERQLISEAEADQVAQAVVEDSLTRAFSGPCSGIDFKEGMNPDQLAIGRSALKMRIGVEALIRTCDQRLGEQQAVEREVGGGHAVFALSEAEHTSGALSEYEKMVLNFIDGKATVEAIATLCRDSTLNLGRVMRSLIAKKIIQRVDQHRTSGVRPAITGSSSSGVKPSAVPAAPATTSAIAEMQPYRRVEREDNRGSRPIVLVGLVSLLVIALAVAVLVVQYNGKQDSLRKDEAAISQLVTARNWREARSLIERLRQAAGNDLTAIRTVDELKAQVEAAIVAERASIGELIEAENFAAAHARLAALPEDTGLAQRLREAEADQRAAAAALAVEVRTRLTSGDIAGALAALDDNQGAKAAEANLILATWREDTLIIAHSQTHPLQLRLASVARLRQARPDSALEAKLVALDGELQAQVQELAKRLARLENQAKAGAWEEVRAELATLRVGSLGAGTEVEVWATRVVAAADQAERDLALVQRQALTALASGAGAEGLEEVRSKLASVLQNYPQASGREAIDRIASSLAACSGVGPRTAAERAADATVLAGQVPAGETALNEALLRRVTVLQEIEGQARASLDEARRFGRVGDWDAAVKALEAIVRQPNWQLTAVRAEAELELDAARAKSVRRVQLKEELRTALLRGDLAICEGIAREIGLAYLPLVIASTPAGAEVVGADGKVLGLTPLIHDVTADQRVELSLTVRKAGYQAVVVNGAAAEGGWRVAVRLERSLVLAQQLGHPLTARPAVVNGALWLAEAGAVRSAPVGIPLSEPIFAPVAEVGGELLLVTRENLALRLGATIERMPLPVASDFPLLTYKSPLVLDRELLVIAGNDGRLYAVQRGTTTTLWQSQGGAAFASAPQLLGESILLARRDGRLESYRIEDGQLEHSAALEQPVLSSWSTPNGLAGLTSGRAWTWNGTAAGEDLPEPSVGGGAGVVVTSLGKVLLRGEQGWSEVGRLDPRPQVGAITAALVWSGHAVVVSGHQLAVFGAAPFRLDTNSDLLAPVLWNGDLVAASLEGGLWMWSK